MKTCANRHHIFQKKRIPSIRSRVLPDSGPKPQLGHTFRRRRWRRSWPRPLRATGTEGTSVSDAKESPANRHEIWVMATKSHGANDIMQ